MKYVPKSLEEALALRHGYPALALTFSNTAKEECIVLCHIPEIDLIFEDHGHYIFGLNASLAGIKDYLESRDSKLATQLLPITNMADSHSVLGEIIISNNVPEGIQQSLENCNASLKTYDGTSGRSIVFMAGTNTFDISAFKQYELPMLILFPK